MWDYYKKNEEKINPKRIFKKRYQHKENKHGTKRVTVPKSVQWSMKHPFQAVVFLLGEYTNGGI